MEQYQLTIKEFIYLCIRVGSGKIYGIKDEFKTVQRENLSAEFSAVQKTLMQKKYLRMDFDGNVTIKKNILDLINICVACERAVLFTVSGDDKSVKRNFYFQKDKVLSVTCENGVCLLEQVSGECVKSILETELIKTKNNSYDEESIISAKHRDIPKLMKENNIRKYRCYSIVVVDKAQKTKVKNLLLMETNKGLLSVDDRIEGLNNVMDIRNCSLAKAKIVLRKLLESES